MKALFGLGSLVLALIPAAAMAQQPAICERVVFSEEVLARFPNIRSACLDVISRDGQEFAVVKADLVRATSRRMTVRVKRPDGTHTDPMGINIAPNARVNINGRQTPISDVAVGQELSVYINVKDPGIALASEAPGPVEFTPVTAEPEPAPVASRRRRTGNAEDRHAPAAGRHARPRAARARRRTRDRASSRTRLKERTMRMSKWAPTAIAAALILSACAAPPPKPVTRENLIQRTATVESIDQASRLVTLRGEDGHGFTVQVSEEARNLSQVKAGDKVTVSYFEALAAEVRKEGEGVQGVEADVAAVRAEPGQMPGGGRRRAAAHDGRDRVRGHDLQHRDLPAFGRCVADGRDRDARGTRVHPGPQAGRPRGHRLHRGVRDRSEAGRLIRLAGERACSRYRAG